MLVVRYKYMTKQIYILRLMMLLFSIQILFINLAKSNNITHMSTQESGAVLAKATFGGGCFWCLEAIFTEIQGVKSVTSGFSGGHLPNPTYEQVVTGSTGHAEVVQIYFDPAEIGYLKLLEVFFSIHDPTTLNRQGNDIGTQYRSAIFAHDEEQKGLALKVINRLTQEGVYDDPIVTEVTPIDTFYPASDYHQNYFARNPYQGYCQMVIRPKLEKFRKAFDHLLTD